MFESPEDFLAALNRLPHASIELKDAALQRQARLTKPAGSLGRLEEVSVWMQSWQSGANIRLDQIEGLLFAGTHGVVEEGVSAYPAEVTAQMVANFQAGGAAINAISRAYGHSLKVIPIALEKPTGNFTRVAAMSEAETLEAINIGAEAVEASEAELIYFGEMGIGNTTVASALSALVLGGDGEDWAGPGTGLEAEGIARKAVVVDQALSLHKSSVQTAFDAMRCLGGRELAAIMGGVVAARLARLPVILDGFVVCAAVCPLVLHGLDTLEHCLVGHCSLEPGHQRLLDALWLDPLLNLGMRLGEGTGAALAAELVRAAVATYNDMATFEDAQVATKSD